MYEGIQSQVISTTRFDENLSTTYLGGIDTTRAIKINAEEKIPISEQGYMIGKLLDGTECQILLDTKQVIHVQITLFTMQIFTFVTRICF